MKTKTHLIPLPFDLAKSLLVLLQVCREADPKNTKIEDLIHRVTHQQITEEDVAHIFSLADSSEKKVAAEKKECLVAREKASQHVGALFSQYKEKSEKLGQDLQQAYKSTINTL